MTKHLTVVLTVEAKDEYENPQTGQWGPGGLPAPDAVVSRIQDVLADVTKNDETIGWRITKAVRAR